MVVAGQMEHGAGARCNVRSAGHAQFPSSPLATTGRRGTTGKMGLEAVLVQTKHKLCIRKTNRAHLTLIFYFLRWVPQSSNFGI